MAKEMSLLCPPSSHRDALRPLEYGDPILAKRLAPCAKNAPKPFPTRDWKTMDERLPRWEYAAFEDALRNNRDTLHRDVYSIEKHLAAWQITEDMHQWSRVHNAGAPKDVGLYLFSAAMGEGKSLLMSAIAWTWYAFRGVPIISNMSLRFGHIVSGAQIFSAMERAEAGSIVIIDEIAALMDSYAGGSNRGRTFIQYLTSFRKKGLLMLVGTANEVAVHQQIKLNAEAIVQPTKYTPLIKQPNGDVHWSRTRSRPYPKFCYIESLALQQPWENVRVVEESLSTLLRGGKEKEKVRDPHSGKRFLFECPPPGVMNITAMTMDTLERVPAGDSFDVTRDTMTRDRQNLLFGEDAENNESAKKMTLLELQHKPNAKSFLLWLMGSTQWNPGAARVGWDWLVAKADACGVELEESKFKSAVKKGKNNRSGITVGKNEEDSLPVSSLWTWYHRQTGGETAN